MKTNNIKTLFACAFFLFMASCTSSLMVNDGKKWNGKEALQKVTDETVFYLDYVRLGHKSALKDINHEDIARITMYDKSNKKAPKAIKGDIDKGVVVLITKKYAISNYRPKLSSISKEYLERTENEPEDRDDLMYVINDEIVKPNVEGALLDLNFSKIKSVIVLSADEAQKIYGDAAVNGAVLIK